MSPRGLSLRCKSYTTLVQNTQHRKKAAIKCSKLQDYPDFIISSGHFDPSSGTDTQHASGAVVDVHAEDTLCGVHDVRVTRCNITASVRVGDISDTETRDSHI